MGDETSQSSPRRLRNHSYKDSVANSSFKMSGKLPEVAEDSENAILIGKDDFAKKTTVQKLDAVADAINKVYEKMNRVEKSLEEKIQPLEGVIYSKPNGEPSTIDQLAKSYSDSGQAIQSLMEENVQLRDELDVLKGVVHKISNQLDSTNGKVNNLIAKSMEDNLVFTGILGDAPRAKPRQQLHEFLAQEMGLMDIRDYDIISVYRMGPPGKNNSNRPIVAQCTPELRRYIMNNAPILKHRKNAQNGKYYINQQLPEAIAENRREIRQIIKDQKTKEEELPQNSKSTFVVRNDKLFINGQLKRKRIVAPQVQQLFPEEKQQEQIMAIKMRYFHTQPEKGSEFKVAILKTDSYTVLHNAYIRLFQKYPAADHIAVASRIKGEEAFNDNGEFGSGYRILREIKQSGLDNIAIFLIWYFGGQHLGPRRFVIMKDLVAAALEKIQEQTNVPLQTSPKQALAHPEMAAKQQDHSSNSGISSEEEIKEED